MANSNTGAHDQAAPNVTVTTSSASVASQGIKFIISGGISAVVDLGLTYLCQIVFGFSAAGGRTIGFIFGTITAYLINRRWTFQAEASTKRFLQVAVLYTITYFVNVGGHSLLFSLLTHYGVSEQIALVIAFVISQGTATVINFFVQRIFIFK
ncbi:GtrA family protein [Corynebacterium pseudotuberculosis]|uniref:GtrA family protein n=1 Tax=Corynebacterium pseudotuberculosis (strain C231) TaxID=681645 RepID=D9QDN3_CORP2|nr:GtrA family protein [Corynebacterium pseudotuberculosis]ADK27902.1 GtrA family protein [Corynebacterium pseudotuberculosis FRC41]ADL09606.1 GtrA family protein [Corynebacterium pseudotuberculosis C231]ADL20014.1 GtrA family protein [Corynebacterium pseudotuberculosis 1002]ADO25404.1 GtrA family protein [Corynebacterium pseudotuberculosis I19]AEK91456.1 GtrA-like integral membrane protein [Corynebacterium pseudotuberculosis PAT10]